MRAVVPLGVFQLVDLVAEMAPELIEDLLEALGQRLHGWRQGGPAASAAQRWCQSRAAAVAKIGLDWVVHLIPGVFSMCSLRIWACQDLSWWAAAGAPWRAPVGRPVRRVGAEPLSCRSKSSRIVVVRLISPLLKPQLVPLLLMRRLVVLPGYTAKLPQIARILHSAACAVCTA